MTTATAPSIDDISALLLAERTKLHERTDALQREFEEKRKVMLDEGRAASQERDKRMAVLSAAHQLATARVNREYQSAVNELTGSNDHDVWY